MCGVLFTADEPVVSKPVVCYSTVSTEGASRQNHTKTLEGGLGKKSNEIYYFRSQFSSTMQSKEKRPQCNDNIFIAQNIF